MKLQFTAMCLACTLGAYAQVGIGTTTPNASLEIQSSSDALPALEINPQTDPVGTASGQLSVIGDQLYLYDSTRSKWLSVESSTINFGREGSVNNVNLEYAGDITKSGPKMARKGTIVYVAMNSSGGNATKTASIDITTPSGVETNHDIALIGGSRIYNSFNVDFEEGDSIQVMTDGAGGGTDDMSVVLWIKWRN